MTTPRWTATHQAVAVAVAVATGVPARRMPSGPVDWTVFAGLVARHRVGPLVHRSGLLPGLGAPAGIVDALAVEAHRAARRALRQLAFLAALVPALRAAGIEAAVLKGLPLASLAYGDCAARHPGDLDVLVSPARVADAVEVCAGLGLRPAVGVGAAALAHVERLRAEYAVCLTGDDLTVDLHWRLFANERLQPVDPRWLSHPATARVGSFDLPVLPRDALWRHVANHGTKHGWRRLKWLADVPALAGRGGIRPACDDADRCVATGLRVAERVLGPFLDDDTRAWAAGVRGAALLERRALAQLAEPDRPYLTPARIGGHLLGRLALHGSVAYRWHEAGNALIEAGRLQLVPDPGAWRTLRGLGGCAWRQAARTAAALGRRRVLLEAAAELTRASVELAVLPSTRVLRLVGTAGPASVDTQANGGADVGRAVARVAARLPWRPTCLRQSLAAARMLRRRRIDARVHLGAADPGALVAHAWVTVGDRVVVGARGRGRFTPLACLAVGVPEKTPR